VATTAQTLERAIALHRAGRLDDAAAGYREVLAADPKNFTACWGLGVVMHAQGKTAEAVEPLAAAVASQPAHAGARFNLGVVLGTLERFDEGAAHLEEAVRLAPGSPEIADALRQTRAMQQNQQAMEHARQGKFNLAAACCRKAVELTPHHAVAHDNLGRVLKGQGMLNEAAECFRRAIALDERMANAHCSLGQIAFKQKNFDEAAACFRRTLELAPESAEAWNGLGAALVELKQFQEAEASFRRFVRLRPGHAEGANNIGTALGRQGKMAEAAEWFRRALEIKPDYGEAHYNLGNSLKEQNRLEEAVIALRRATELEPQHVHAQLALGFSLLGLGRLGEGWPHYEWRWKVPEMKDVTRHEPRWQGEDLAGRTILLDREQGYGDTLQFVRYAALVKKRGARVIVECAPPVAALLKTCPGVDEVTIAGAPLPAFDFAVPLLSLPGLLGTTLESIPAEVPYVHPDETLVDKWGGELRPDSEFSVGIAWQGNPTHGADEFRSIPLSYFEPVVRTSGVRVYSIQMGAGREQLAQVARDWPIVDLADRLGDFHNTAAIVRNLDLVITCDSAPAHLAGALGVPVWVALAFAPDWRWMLDREDCPWYPTMRLFRQPRPKDWSSVFARIAQELGKPVPR
jgi:tetratricopeptide (TPR) repeat protein